MKTIIIVAHPHVEESRMQQFLIASSVNLEDVTTHLLTISPIDVNKERELLNRYDRIIFQFPMYWYSAPYLLKKWIDEVFSDQFAQTVLKKKELGLVIGLSEPEKSFSSGMPEHFTLSELLKPYEALANKCGMIFLPIFPVSLFSYMTEEERKRLLISYQFYLTSNNKASFRSKEEWFIERLKAYEKKSKDSTLEKVLEVVLDNQQSLEELRILLSEMR